MMSVFEVPVRSDNYVWIMANGSGACAVVDPGEAEPVVAALQERGLTPEAILITHHHGDHVAGVAGVLAQWDVPVYGPAAEQIPHRTHALAEGDTVTLPGLGVELAVFETPGHTAGHISYYGDGALFCGDTLFAGGCGRLFEGTPEDMIQSLGKLAELPPETRVYAGHEYTESNLRFAVMVEPGNEALGERLEAVRSLRAAGTCSMPSTLEDELRTNPFLRSGVEEVRASAEKRAGQRLTSPVEVFATVRHWKDAS